MTADGSHECQCGEPCPGSRAAILLLAGFAFGVLMTILGLSAMADKLK